MTKAQKTTAAMVAAMAMTVGGRASANDEPIAATDQREAIIVVHVVNYAGLSRDVLDGAKTRVASVYAVIGVRTVWVDGQDTGKPRRDGPLHLTVMLLSREMAQKKISAEGLSDHLLGQAHLPSGRAYIFCDRIATMPGAPTYFPIPLGDVIAHEVGHLVLRSNRHSRSGIMRANADVHAIHLQSFDKTQARSIRTMLMEPTARATAR
jgi:hypothetical protein